MKTISFDIASILNFAPLILIGLALFAVGRALWVTRGRIGFTEVLPLAVLAGAIKYIF